MKKALTPALIVLFALFMVLPIINLIAIIGGLGFKVGGEMAFGIVLTALALAETLCLLIMRIRLSKTGRIFAIMILPASILNACAFIRFDNAFTMIFAIICSVCALLIFIKCSDDCTGKAISAAVSVLLVIALVVLYIIFAVFGKFLVTKTAKKTFESPSGTYTATMYTVDKGLLGTKVTVEIGRNGTEKGVIVGKLFEKPIEIYEGPSTDVHTAKADWLDEETFVINGVAYAAADGKIIVNEEEETSN